MRGHLAELGIVSAKGRNGTAELLADHCGCGMAGYPAGARYSRCAGAAVRAPSAAEIGSIDKSIMAWHRSCEASRRLEEIPGIGPIVATALVAEIGDWKAFGSGRSLAAWIGLVPKQHSTGGKDRLGSITKQGNRYLRWLLVVGAMAVIRYARKHGTQKRPWLGAIDGAPTDQGGGRRARQQDCADGLGHHGPRREIQGAEAVAGGMRARQQIDRQHQLARA